MTTFAALVPEISVSVPGCPNPLIELELKRAAQAFFAATRAWRVVQPLVAVAADQSDVTITPADAGQELVRVERVWLDGQRLDVTTPNALDFSTMDDWRLHTGTPTHFLQISPSVVRLYRIPTAASVTGLKADTAVRPSESATAIPDELAIRYRESLIAGARSRLHIEPGKAWTDPATAGIQASMFEAGIGAARHAVAKSFGRGRPQSRPSWH